MSHTVLVADDSTTIRKIVEMALKASDYQVVGVGSAQDAMEAARREPSVILLDYYMPDGSGYDVCRALKADGSTAGIPVIMLGGTYKSFDEAQARDAGADGIVMKPFKTDTLIGAIEAVKGGAAAAPPAPVAPPVAPTPAPPAHTPLPVAAAPVAASPMALVDPEPEAPRQQQHNSRHPAPQQQQQQPPRAPTPTPTPTPAGGSQPRIATPDVNASSRQPASQPAISAATTAGSGPIGVGRAEIEKMIREEVKSAVKAELPAMLRSVMGETFQKKVLPKLIAHTEERVKTMISERMETAIREQVRIELERLLAE